MDAFDEAAPRLREAHRLMYEVAQICGDVSMAAFLEEAMPANREAQACLRVIEQGARDASC